MAKKMMQCKTCGKDIAVSAKTCPHCGEKNNKPIYKRGWFIILIFFVMINMLPSCVGLFFDVMFESTYEKVGGGILYFAELDGLEKTSEDILAEYEKNPKAASKAYENKLVTVKAWVSDIRENSIVDDISHLYISDPTWLNQAMQNINELTLESLEDGDIIEVQGRITSISETTIYIDALMVTLVEKL